MSQMSNKESSSLVEEWLLIEICKETLLAQQESGIFTKIYPDSQCLEVLEIKPLPKLVSTPTLKSLR